MPCEISHSAIAPTALFSQGHHYCLPPRSANLPAAPKVVSQPHISVTSSLQATVLSHTWHKLRSTNPPPKAQIIMLLYCQEALVHPSESNVEQIQILANRCNLCFCSCLLASSVGVWMSLGLACAVKFVSGTLSGSLGEIKFFWVVTKKSEFGSVSIESHSVTFGYN